MSVIEYQSGITTPTPDSRPLYIVHLSCFDDWLDSLSEAGQNWVRETAMPAKAGSCIILPDKHGQLSAAALLIDKNIIWEGAGAASKLPAASWAPEMTFAAEAGLGDIQLGWGLAQYHFAPHKPEKTASPKATLALSKKQQDKAIEAQIMGTHITREMVNQPANKMTPQGIEAAAKKIAQTYSASVKVVKGKVLEGYAPALHVVGRAAEVPPRLIDMSWGEEGPIITLVGKGISFDSGGLDIKPSRAMELMKKDMGGAAHVLGLATALMAANVKIRLRVLIAAAENAISERAMRPLDVIETAAGIAVEVGNTDAEGRLVLADALHYALHDKNHPEPDFVVDFATLTGAARVALGTECPALFCNHSQTAQQLMHLGADLDDPLWQLPLFEAYDRYLDVGQAGLSSTGHSGYGGAITAALFLRRFVGKQADWAHIDVMAWNLSSRPGRPKGGEAMGLRTLFAFIQERAT
jgi:leucyl aminopeptidase